MNIRIWLSIVLFFAFSTVFSQGISFNYFGISEGLSQNTVMALAQDSLGRIWIGTRDGLNDL